jgi:dTDP-glucose 4,6-dehydratase
MEPFTMRQVLVTGGCGFIGSNLVRYLRDVGPDLMVVNLDALTYAGNPADLAGHPWYCFVKGDITNRDDVARALDGGVEAVLHLAYDRDMLGITRGPKLPPLAEMEITDVNKEYLQPDELSVQLLG